MGRKTRQSPDYTALARAHEDDPEFSYFEASKGYQEAAQTEIIETAGKSERLPQQLSDAAHRLAAQFFKETADAAKTDCEKGCSYCCYQPATVFPFEAIRIAEILKNSRSKDELTTLVEKLNARVGAFQDGSVKKNVNNKTACPLLVEERCSVYDNRPLTCRMAHSFSVKRCSQSFEKDRLKVQIPMSLGLLTGISGIIEGAFEQLPEEGLDGNLYELCSAVLAALADPAAGLKWATGDSSVFKSCIRDDT